MEEQKYQSFQSPLWLSSESGLLSTTDESHSDDGKLQYFYFFKSLYATYQQADICQVDFVLFSSITHFFGYFAFPDFLKMYLCPSWRPFCYSLVRTVLFYIPIFITIKSMLRRRKYSHTYLATFFRHRWNAQMTMKKDNLLELSASTVAFIS